jgi:hypothetical protein
MCLSCFEANYAIRPTCSACNCDIKSRNDEVKLLSTKEPSNYRALCNTFKVRCPLHHNTGCDWIGYLGDMERHITVGYVSAVSLYVSPFHALALICRHYYHRCQLHPQGCEHCKKSHPRGTLPAHKAICDRRPYPCQFCHLEMPYDEVKDHIGGVCREAPIPCETIKCRRRDVDGNGNGSGDEKSAANIVERKGCGQLVARGKLQIHQRDTCSQTLVKCRFKKLVGCSCEPVERGHIDIHEQHHLPHHFLLAMRKTAPLIRRSQDENRFISCPRMISGNILMWRDQHNEWQVSPPATQVSGAAVIQWTKDDIARTGGWNVAEEKVVNTFEVFNILTRTWTTLPNLPFEGLDRHCAVSVNGKLYVVAHNQLWVYKPTKRRWLRIDSGGFVPRCDASAVSFDNKIYVFGGKNKWDGPVAMDSAQCFDDLTGIWTTLAPMPIGKCGHSTVVVKDTIIIIGGAAGHNGGYHDTIVEYTPSTNRYRVLPFVLPSPSQCLESHYDDFNQILTISGGQQLNKWSVPHIWCRSLEKDEKWVQQIDRPLLPVVSV